MPVDERTYAADVAGWVNLILRDRPDLPFWNARVEEHTDPGLSTRHDFRLYTRHTNTPVLSGEIKMPDTVPGRHPLSTELVNDALTKASKVGVRYCFTWNVRQFVLFDSHIQNVPYSQRAIEGPRDVVDVYQSDDVYRELVKTEVISYWKEFLDQFAALLQGRRSIDPAPLDRGSLPGWKEPSRMRLRTPKKRWPREGESIRNSEDDWTPGCWRRVGRYHRARISLDGTWNGRLVWPATSWSPVWCSTRCSGAGSAS